ncbi:MAG: hypothetical protein ABFE01_07395 [Phycisphaerales bacterium]
MDKLTRKQIKAIPIILSEKTIEAGCKKAGISKSSFYRWMLTEGFRAEFDRQCTTIAADALRAVQQNVGRATECLIQLMESTDHAVRWRAAVNLLERFDRHFGKANGLQPSEIVIHYEEDLDSLSIEELEMRLRKLESEEEAAVDRRRGLRQMGEDDKTVGDTDA